MTTLQESAMRLALAALTSTDALPYEDWMRASGHPAIKALNAALAQQDDSLQAKYLKSELAHTLAQQGEQRCTYCDGTGDVHSIDGEWRGTCHCAAAPTPPAQQGEPVAQARLGMQDGLAMALSVVELYGMKGDVIYREIAKLRDGIAAAPAPQPAQEPRHTIPR